MTKDTSPTGNQKVLQKDIEEYFMKLWDKATIDAITLGVGVVIIRANSTVERIPPEEYSQLVEMLEWVQKNHKQLEKEHGGKVH